MPTFPEIEVEVLEEEDVRTDDLRDLIVFNDEVNTFDHVIATLIKVCPAYPRTSRTVHVDHPL